MLETLEGVTEIGGNKIIRIEDRPLDDKGEVDWDAYDKMRETTPIAIDDEQDMISFKMMTKPALEGGEGCQLTVLVETAIIMLKKLNSLYPCKENDETLHYWGMGLRHQELRTKDREQRNVEGKNEV